MGGLLPKPDTTKHTEDGAGSGGSGAYGVSAMQGWRKAMEDAHLAVPDFDVARQLGLFGVFDGHGGAAVAKVAAERLPELLRQLPAFQEGRYEEALHEAFLRLDAYLDSAAGRETVAKQAAACGGASDGEDSDDSDEVLRKMIASGEIDAATAEDSGEEEGEDDSDFAQEGEEEEEEQEEEEEENEGNLAWANAEGPDGMGTTAVVALVRGGATPEVICANAGDSRCVLARGARALDMSRDHKPTLKSERTRIVKAGGFVNGEGRVDGNLNLSRALGDFAYKKDKSLKPTEQKISCEAEVRRQALGAADRYLLLGCDGIFEKVTSQALVDFLLPRLQRPRPGGRARGAAPLSRACSAFLDANLARCPPKEQGLGCDNMTLMVVQLHPGPSRQRPAAAKRRPALAPFGGRQEGLARRAAEKGRQRAVCRRRLIMRAHRRHSRRAAAAAGS